jgi:septum formation protein
MGDRNTYPTPLILASASPRRLELLTQAGVEFSVAVAGVDETPRDNESPQVMVERLALLKAETVATVQPNAYVIGADTTVFIDGESLGKPESELAAYDMLMRIQGRTHEVWGGIAIVQGRSGFARVWSHMTEVTMRPMTKQQVLDYVATKEPLDKAGSYAIQGIGLQFVDSIHGSYSNVVGLNIATLLAELRDVACNR